MSDIEEVTKAVNKFRDDRNWRQFHNAKDLAISISLEASELLEDFQWKDSQTAIENNLENIKEEIADVLIYTMMLTTDLDLDIAEIVYDKLAKNCVKYPLKKSEE